MTRAVGRPALLLGASALLLAIQLWIIGQWAAAYSAATSQDERVRHFLAELPLGLGRLGAANLTWLGVAVGSVGLLAALAAARGSRGVGRGLGIGLAGANGVVVLWSLFTML